MRKAASDGPALFPDALAVPKGRRKKAEPPVSDGSTQRLMDAYKVGHEWKWKIKALPNYPRDMKILKDVVALVGGEVEALALLREFFTTKHPRITACDYTVPEFKRLLHHLRLATSKNGHARPDARTAQNEDAVARATGRLK